MGTDVVERLRDTLPAGRVLTGEAIDPRHETDHSRYPPNRPRALLLPRSTKEVQVMLAICEAARQPVVPQGGMTGTSAGAHPLANEIAMSLEKMTGVQDIDAAGVMTVWAGTPLQVVQDAARQAGWICGIDIGARGSCTIGGNVATNAGGNTVIRYGMTRDNVLGLEVVLADGRVLESMNRVRKNTSGYDLKQLFIGSEGTLGVVTQVVLQLHPLPTSHECAFAAVRDYDAALRLLRAAQRDMAGAVSSFEVMWPEYYDFMVDRVGLPAPLSQRHPLYVLLDVRGPDDAADRERLENLLQGLLETGELLDVVIAQSYAEVGRLWRIREEVSRIPPLLAERSLFDVSFPIARMNDAIGEIRAIIAARWPGGTGLYFGHIGDGNVHIVVSLPEHKLHAADLDEVVFDTVRRHQGAVAAEHGIGRKRRAFLGHSRTAEELAVMRLMKHALDPHGILNPGKVI